MKKYLPKLLFLTFSFLIFPAVSFAEVSKIVFTTDPQSIKPNTPSSVIKVQFQDSSGVAQSFGETSKMTFESSSATGNFLNESGNSVSTTVNSNWTGRTFYYQDSSQGTFSITIGIEGKDLEVSQQITVSSGATENNNQNTSGEVLGVSTSTSSNVGSSGGSTIYISSLNSQLEIVAGSDRTTSVGSPIWFQATVKKNTTGTSPELNWSFGDGNVGVGSLVSHTYKYLGDYVVVLSARAGDMFSVSRLKVKVTGSDISILDKGQYLEITNNSNTEINLFNWKIENQGKGFIFQPNTIILPKSSIKLDKSLLKMKGYDNSLGTVLKNALGEEVFVVAPPVSVKEIDMDEVSKNIENIKNEALVIQSKIGSKIENTKIKTKEAEKIAVATSTENIQYIIYEAPKSEGVISRLTNFIKRVFSN